MEKYLVTFSVEVYKEDTEKNIEKDIRQKIDWMINDGEGIFANVLGDSILVIKEKNNPYTSHDGHPSIEE